jgi:pimeloyl-ACP methyl ester carboxylesterase
MGGDVGLYHRDVGTGRPLLLLHGGWGYEFYPHDLARLAAAGYRCLVPDRSGYGKSGQIHDLPPRFHHAAAEDMTHFLDGLGIDRCDLWGHSDGAVIAAIMGQRQPERHPRVILEALHVDRVKPRSRGFFTMMAENPDGFGPRIAARLAADHGPEYWRAILRAGGRAWLHIAATPDEDFYDQRLADLRTHVLLMHGSDDPRTEPGELDRVWREVPRVSVYSIPGAGHCPHSEREGSVAVHAAALRFLQKD